MRKIVYVLGAGFSAYAGIPFMSNFIDKAKDIYFSNSDKSSNRVLAETFRLINEYAIIMQTMNSNLSNIEELLSIYEMSCFTKKKNPKLIKNFIKYVIDYYENIYETKAIAKYDYNSTYYCFDNIVPHLYFVWLFSISGINKLEYQLRKESNAISKIHGIADNNYKYDLISLNYDTLLEKTCSIANGIFNLKINLDREGNKPSAIRYCKLHGSIDTDTIVPPTRAKLNLKNIKNDWAGAFHLLSNANEIRILGFSFPETDNHLKYLFKSAIRAPLKTRNNSHII